MSVSVLVLVWFVHVHGSLVSKRVRWPKHQEPRKSVLNRSESQVQLKEAVNIESVAVAINAKTFQKVKSNTADAQTPWWDADDLHQVLKWRWFQFTIFVIELLEDSKALYKPCSRWALHKIIMLGPIRWELMWPLEVRWDEEDFCNFYISIYIGYSPQGLSHISNLDIRLGACYWYWQISDYSTIIVVEIWIFCKVRGNLRGVSGGVSLQRGWGTHRCKAKNTNAEQ